MVSWVGNADRAAISKAREGRSNRFAARGVFGPAVPSCVRALCLLSCPSVLCHVVMSPSCYVMSVSPLPDMTSWQVQGIIHACRSRSRYAYPMSIEGLQGMLNSSDNRLHSSKSYSS